MPASRTTLPQRTISDFHEFLQLVDAPVLPIGRNPYLSVCSFTSGIASTAVISALSLSRIGRGVCAGAAIACHDTAS